MMRDTTAMFNRSGEQVAAIVAQRNPRIVANRGAASRRNLNSFVRPGKWHLWPGTKNLILQADSPASRGLR